MDLEAQAIRRIHLAAELSAAYYQKPLLLAYSGGKDSEVCLELCRRAHIPLEVIHHLTTADAPETIYHVRNVFRQLELEGIACAFHIPHFGKAAALFRVVRRWRHRHAPFWLLSIGKEGVTENGQQDQAFRAASERA